MNDHALVLPADTATRLDNLARRLGLPLDEALAAIAARMDLMDHIAAVLSVSVCISPCSTVFRLRPEHPVSEDIAAIYVTGPLIETVLSHADDRFTSAVRALHYRWNGRRWERRITKFAEPLADRAVELGVHILNAGFPVEVPTEDLHHRIAAGDYRPEVKTWLTARSSGHFAGWFCLQWDRDGLDYYRQARLITGSRCYPGAALIPAAYYDEALDFAQQHDFAISDGALDLANRARAERAAMLLASPAIQTPPASTHPLLSAAPVAEGILDELADDPL